VRDPNSQAKVNRFGQVFKTDASNPPAGSYTPRWGPHGTRWAGGDTSSRYGHGGMTGMVFEGGVECCYSWDGLTRFCLVQA
jgi:hypothetical protein